MNSGISMQTLWSFADYFFSRAFKEENSSILHFEQASSYYALAYCLAIDDRERSSLKKNIADAQYFISYSQFLQGVPFATFQIALESAFKIYKEASELAVAENQQLQSAGWFHRLQLRQEMIVEWLWSVYESSSEDFNVRRSKLQQLALAVKSHWQRGKCFLNLGLQFLAQAKWLKQQRNNKESLDLLIQNQLNIEEAKKEGFFIEEVRLLENQNNFKIYKLQILGQYNEKELRERFFDKFRDDLKKEFEILERASTESAEALIAAIYNNFPPKHEAGKQLSLDLNSKLKKALFNYHEDRQDAKIDGWKWIVLCGEITRKLNYHKDINK